MSRTFLQTNNKKKKIIEKISHKIFFVLSKEQLKSDFYGIFCLIKQKGRRFNLKLSSIKIHQS
jgi:hypothetical protein